MAKAKQQDSGFPPDTEIDLVCIKGEKIIVKSMPYGDYLKIKKKPDWEYKIFQKGFHSYKNT